MLLLQNALRYCLLIFAVIRFFIGDILHENTKILTLSLIFLSILTVNYKSINYKYYLIILCLIGVAFAINDGASLGVITIFLIAASCANLNIRYMSAICLILQCFFLYYMTYMTAIGEIVTHTITYEKGTTTDLGFGNSNSFSLYISSMIYCGYICFQTKTSRGAVLLLVLLCSILSYSYTLGRTILIGEIVCVITGSILILKYNILMKLKYLIALFPIIAIVFIIIVLFNVTQFELLNKMFTGRIVLWFNHFNSLLNNGSIIFGYNLENYYDQPLDCSYITLLVYGGIIGFICYSLFLYNSIKKGMRFLLPYFPIICGMLISGLTENVLLAFSPINILLITIFYKGLYGCPNSYCYNTSI